MSKGLSDVHQRGEVVAIKSLSDILQSLDARGTKDALPFMPEMARYAGGTHVVSSRLAKACVEVPNVRFGVFKNEDVFILDDLRCDGSAHGGCQKQCSFLWKVAWLTPASSGTQEQPAPRQGRRSDGRATPHRDDPADCLPTRTGDGRYICQSTELASAVNRMTLSQRLTGMMEDWRTVVLGAARVAYRRCEMLAWRLTRRTTQRGLGSLGLVPGEEVMIKPASEIVRELDNKATYRGLAFPRAMLAFCGRKFTVKARIEKMIREDTGTMVTLKDTVLLEGAVCDGVTCHGLCHRQQYYFWRESWLQKPPSETDGIDMAIT